MVSNVGLSVEAVWDDDDEIINSEQLILCDLTRTLALVGDFFYDELLRDEKRNRIKAENMYEQ